LNRKEKPMAKKLIAATIVAGALAVGASHAAPDSNTAVEMPDFSGIWDRGNESWFHAVPGGTDGKPLVRISNNPQQEAGDAEFARRRRIPAALAESREREPTISKPVKL
jgi:hypothetical protein